LEDGHDEASDSGSEAKVHITSSSDPVAACDNPIVSETEFYCLDEQTGEFNK
jgi:hypothetical protein